jgi:protein-tyrosine-phosphatase
MKILFICKHNRFRSKVAEALFNNLIKKQRNKDNKKITAFSRGVSLDKQRMYVAVNVKKALRRFGVGRVDNMPRKLTKKDIKIADLIIVSADNVKLSRKLIKGKKIIYWNIKDTSQSNYTGILARVKIIRKKVWGLIRSLRYK